MLVENQRALEAGTHLSRFAYVSRSWILFACLTRCNRRLANEISHKQGVNQENLGHVSVLKLLVDGGHAAELTRTSTFLDSGRLVCAFVILLNVARGYKLCDAIIVVQRSVSELVLYCRSDCPVHA